MEKYCERCGEKFECKAENIAHCDCATIKLDATMLAYLSKQFKQCICLQCLQTLQQQNKNIQP